ncbi:hypothetical protein 7865G3C9_29 [Haloquadratum phage sp.]|jgi:hypothetical protein|nr:hypothetical protein 7865G3C9_29 [Haloquadratum phage sp.]
MGNKKKQPTPIDEQTYERFKNYVKDVHGHTRGHLKTEIENALRDYMQSDAGEKQLTRIEDDVATAVNMLSTIQRQSDSDGGSPAPTVSDGESARARDLNKPRANQPRKDKLDYLLTKLLRENPCDRQSGELPKSDFTEIIQTEYDFSEDTVEEYKSKLIDRLDAEEHPRHGVTVAWGKRYSDIVDDLREKADEEMTDL